MTKFIETFFIAFMLVVILVPVVVFPTIWAMGLFYIGAKYHLFGTAVYFFLTVGAAHYLIELHK